MAIEKWALLDSELVFGHRWYQLRRDTVRLPDGTVVDDYFVSVRPEVAIVFPLTPDGNVIFVRQYKHGAQAITLELPGGTFRHELPEDAARRELLEETGHTPDELVPLGWTWEDPTRNTSRVHMFLGLDCRRTAPQTLQDLEGSAGIELVPIPLEEVMPRVRRGEVCAMSASSTILCALDELALRKAKG
jgi:ADP-ribose pyrophosphatase